MILQAKLFLNLLQKILFNKIFFYFERILSNPINNNIIDWIIPIILLPFSTIYCFIIISIAFIKNLNAKIYHENIIGIGNLVLGGSGKTPLIITLAEIELKKNKRVGILLRGYGRNSSGTKLVSHNGKILISVDESGDEARLYVDKLKFANLSVVVAEDRISGILLLKNLKTDIIFLDDSFRQHHIIKKVEYLILSDNKNRFCLPAGGYREKKWWFKKNIIEISENIDFIRKVKIDNITAKMILVTAISKPERLYKYIDKNIPKYIYPDHSNFNKIELLNILEQEKGTSILTTEKDFTKMKEFNIAISLIKLEIEFITGGKFDSRRV